MTKLNLMIRRILSSMVVSVNPRLYFTLSYLHNHKRIPHFSNPKDLSEIWISRLLRGDFEKIYYLADKYEVRKYIESKGLSYILPNLIGVYDRPQDIPYHDLPSKFAIKMNYGAGMNIICANKKNLDVDNTNKRLENWLRGPKYSLAERHYNLINRKIIIEEFIDDGTGGFPLDYKFICINGKAVCCLVCSGRESGHADYLPYDLDWNPKVEWNKVSLPDNYIYPEKPKNFSEMIKIVETLASGIDLVRVDLYSDGINIWFGEMTLTPAGCIFHRWSNQAMDEMGKEFYSIEETNIK